MPRQTSDTTSSDDPRRLYFIARLGSITVGEADDDESDLATLQQGRTVPEGRGTVCEQDRSGRVRMVGNNFVNRFTLGIELMNDGMGNNGIFYDSDNLMRDHR